MSSWRSGRRARSRGFTLLEIMIVAAILGMLASIALPNFSRVNLRAKETERGEVMLAIGRVVSEIQQNERRVPTNGAWNPAVVPDRARHPMTRTLAGWNELPLIVDAPTYYRYQYTIQSGATLDPPATFRLDIYGQGDLDGDGETSTRVMTLASDGDGFHLVDDFIVESGDNF